MLETKEASFIKQQYSLRWILSLTLLLLMLIAALISTLLNYYQVKNQNEHLFKVQMIKSAKMVDAMMATKLNSETFQNLGGFLAHSDLALKKQLSQKKNKKTNPSYAHAFAFQVFNPDDGQMVIRSKNAPSLPINLRKQGFATFKAPDSEGKKSWYVYSMQSAYKNNQIVVLVSNALKQTIFLEMFWSSLGDLLLLYGILALVMLVAVQLALKPLTHIQKALASKDPQKLEPIHVKKAPSEVMPLLTELNHLFEKVNSTIEKERRFSADAAHELKTPLASMITQAQLALSFSDVDKIKAKINNILTGANQYYRIIEQLLTLSRLEPEQTLQHQQTLDMHAVLNEWIKTLAPQAVEKNIELIFDPANHPFKVKGNQTLLGIMINNLIDNAIRYTPSGGEVKIQTRSDGTYQYIDIIDTGYGVDSENLQRIFDRFYRTAGTKSSGTGLGLSIVKKIVQLHNGFLNARSNTPQGLIVEVILP
jgi:two-component system sensor histidine kinase QseC